MIIFAEKQHFDEVYKIWGANRATLGLMPKDAFTDCIRKRWIIVHLNKTSQVDAYLQFRYTNRTQTLSIVHLCVEESARGQGLSAKLVDKLVDEYQKKARGIKLNCRNDYHEAIAFWQKYNFQPKGQRASRGNDPNVELITWWFSFGHQDLFSFSGSDRVKAVLDSNIIIKLRDQNRSDASGEEVLHLQSDWLADEVEFYQTSETLSEIFRDKNLERKEKSKQFLAHFPELNVDKPSVNKLELELQEIFSGKTDNHRSDRRQLAEAILSGFPYFITLDEGIIGSREKISSKYHLKIVSPSSFILEVDAAVNTTDYYPDKLSATSFTIGLLTADEKDNLLNTFLNTGSGEKKSDFSSVINATASNPFGELKVIKEQGEIVAVYGTTELQDKIIVPIIRTKQYFLRQTLFMQNLHNIITESVQKRKCYLVVKDKTLTAVERDILVTYGFFENSQFEYIRAIAHGISTVENLRCNLAEQLKSIPELNNLTNLVIEAKKLYSFHHAYHLEKKLWPLKIYDADIPCFIVPIKPNYARELFDATAAKHDLFGANPSLIWNKENVYYRNVQPNIETFPARILWYASSDKNSNRQKAIVCSSYLDEVITGTAKSLFKKFQKYGIYSWDRDIVSLVNGNANKDIKILRFSDSETFAEPVSLRAVKTLLKRNLEKDNNFQSPLRIKACTFMEIYSLGKNRATDEQLVDDFY